LLQHVCVMSLAKLINRATEDLQQLSFNAQSGGEKSVATALYIIALQEMTQVPFRCVDEINQGMDDSNERQVWRLLAKTADSHSAQFLYLAPKVLFFYSRMLLTCMWVG